MVNSPQMFYKRVKKRKKPREYDKELYEERNTIERIFGKLKRFRRVATLYDKLAVSYRYSFWLPLYLYG